MKWALWFGLLCAIALANCQDEEEEEVDPCNSESCQLPDCRCTSTEIPGDLLPRDTPQFVILSFNDAVGARSIDTYRTLLYNRRNKNGCQSGATFFINHEYNNYQSVNELYNRGFEIGLHSISRKTPQTAWATATYDELRQEIGEQKIQMAHFANIPYESMTGLRLPFLQMTGNTSFEIMRDFDIKYDYSWPTTAFVNPAIWPYTLDFPSKQDCVIPPCPTASIPGAWVLPIITWTDLNGLPCSSVEACFNVPNLADEEAWYHFIVSNFERHYLSNRAPFSFFIAEWYIASYPAVRAAVTRFLDLINNLNDVFLVNAQEVIDWVQEPLPLQEYVQKPCRTWIQTSCPAFNCGPLTAAHNLFAYYIQICNVCPAVYPWVGNPLGLAEEEEESVRA